MVEFEFMDANSNSKTCRIIFFSKKPSIDKSKNILYIFYIGIKKCY